MEAIILNKVPNGYDHSTALVKIGRLNKLVADVKDGKIPQVNAIHQADALIAEPIPVVAVGTDPQKVDEYIARYRRELEGYKLAVYGRLKRVKCGYSLNDFDAKISAYNELIYKLRNGADKVFAMTELERIRQLPLTHEKKGLFSRYGYDCEAADSFLADIDGYALSLTY